MNGVAKFAAGMVGAVFAAEILIRLVSPALPTPLDWPTNTAQAKERLLQSSTQSPTIVLLGSSTVGDALDPEILATSLGCTGMVFNAGVDGASPAGLEVWYELGVAEHASPTSVLIGVVPRDFSSDEFGTAYIRARAADDGVLAEADRRLARVSYLVRYREDLRTPSRWRGIAPPDDDNLDADGFNRTTARVPLAPGGDRGSFGTTFTPVEGQIEALRRVVAMIDADGASPVLVAMPGTDAEYGTWGDPEATRRDFVEFLLELADSMGAGVADLTSISDQELFVDSVHANFEGVEFITTELASQLAPVPC